MYNYFGICVLCKSLVLCGVVPRLYTQVSRAEVTTSNVVVGCLDFFSKLMFNTNVSDTIYIGVRLHCPVQFTVHGCTAQLVNFVTQ